jgi:hypothetical protein
MTETERRLKAQLDANAAAIARMQRQQQQVRQPDPYEEPEYYDAPPAGADAYGEPDNVDRDRLIMQAITQKATQDAVKQVRQINQVTEQQGKVIQGRMKRLVKDFPALADEQSDLVQRAKSTYARIARENPALAKDLKYELAVREAAAYLGARPTSVAAEDADWTMGPGNNPALSNRPTKSRLNAAIVANARLMGINVDPKTVEGKRNLAELNNYSTRFNADVDESHVRYR